MAKTKQPKPFKDYVMGFVVGYRTEGGDLIFYIEEQKPYCKVHRGKKTWHLGPPEPFVFTDADVARKAAEDGQFRSDTQGPPSVWFWRAYKYSTPNPKNAKGMPTWCAQDKIWHWIKNQ